MLILFLKAYMNLIRFEFYLRRGDFTTLYRTVRDHPLGDRLPAPDVVERICRATDMACIWYWKQVHCLQRSAASVCLLKKYGVAAQLVIGAQQLPFKAHAWVEVGGRVANDKPYMQDIYSVLDRC